MGLFWFMETYKYKEHVEGDQSRQALFQRTAGWCDAVRRTALLTPEWQYGTAMETEAFLSEFSARNVLTDSPTLTGVRRAIAATEVGPAKNVFLSRRRWLANKGGTAFEQIDRPFTDDRSVFVYSNHWRDER